MDWDFPTGEAMGAALDESRLSDVLRGMGGSASAFLADFRRSTQDDIRLLAEAVEAADLLRAGDLAHRIRGASRMIGAHRLASACAALGAASRVGDGRQLELALHDLLACWQALQGRLDARQPAGAPAATSPAASAPPPLICKDLDFLVAEDHDFQRAATMRLLRQWGAREVHGFADGAAALAAARALQAPAILVLDLALPVLDGRQVIRSIGAENLPLALVVHSAAGEEVLAARLQEAASRGARVLGGVRKPLTAAKLAPLLAGLRQGRAASGTADGQAG